jgi:hypothetical protein
VLSDLDAADEEPASSSLSSSPPRRGPVTRGRKTQQRSLIISPDLYNDPRDPSQHSSPVPSKNVEQVLDAGSSRQITSAPNAGTWHMDRLSVSACHAPQITAGPPPFGPPPIGPPPIGSAPIGVLPAQYGSGNLHQSQNKARDKFYAFQRTCWDQQAHDKLSHFLSELMRSEASDASTNLVNSESGGAIPLPPVQFGRKKGRPASKMNPLKKKISKRSHTSRAPIGSDIAAAKKARCCSKCGRPGCAANRCDYIG